MFTLSKQSYPAIPDEASWLMSDVERAKETPSELLCEFNACIIGRTEEACMIAALEPRNRALRQYVKVHISQPVEWFTASRAEIAHTLRLSQLDHQDEIERLLSSIGHDESAVPKMVAYLIQYAFKQSASDIHIEPRKRDAIVRFRVDGILHEIFAIPAEQYLAVVARIKILAGLRTDESRRPQDGRIEPDGFEGSSLRVSVMPTLHGEKIVMRILDESSTVLDLQALGFTDAHIAIITKNVEKPYGMIVASGPTGSGKTTSLYALLQLLKNESVNIATLEDPVEYALDRVNQTQVQPDLDFSFAKGLRSLLRQDPDVILVGEIRDHETVSMAANASMTGHLVLTSMHTNDAPSAFSRFLEMGIEEFMVASTINLVIAQRLVRKLCPHCATKALLPESVVRKITERADVCNVLEATHPGSVKKLSSLEVATPVGCEQCLGTGYKGRIGIFELLEMSPAIHDLVLVEASAKQIREAAQKEGFASMITDGIEKVFNGSTTFAEVLRTTRTG